MFNCSFYLRASGMAKKISSNPSKRSTPKTSGSEPAGSSGNPSELQAERLEQVRRGLTNPEILRWVAELFKVMGDPSRLKIVNALLLMDMCVCDLAALLKMSPSAVSHQLQILRQNDLVKWQRRGKEVFYSLDDEHVSNVFYQGLVHVNEKHHG